MKYVGSKAKIAKPITEIIAKYRDKDEYFVEPFCGGCNITQHVTGDRIANDSNFYLIEMYKALIAGWNPPINVTREEYNTIRDNVKKYPPELVAWVGINFSYSGKWFGGYAGRIKISTGQVRDYPLEAYNNVMKQIPKLVGVKFYTGDYSELEIPQRSIVYCDPPYQNTLQYVDGFRTEKFWDWVRCISKTWIVFVSEYVAPCDFVCIWSKYVTSSLSINVVQGSSKLNVERLFVHKSWV